MKKIKRNIKPGQLYYYRVEEKSDFFLILARNSSYLNSDLFYDVLSGNGILPFKLRMDDVLIK